LICGILGLASCEVGTSTRAAPPQDTEVRIDITRPGNTIPRALFGTNVQWQTGGDGLIRGDGSRTHWNQSLLDEIAVGGFSSIRFPGGTLADSYVWRSGIGPAASRPTGKNFAGTSEPSTFGTDELIRLCRERGLGAVLTVNFNISPAEAADWVEYVNGGPGTPMGRLRASHGHVEPLGVRYWEIGNEIYNPNEPGHANARDYAAKFVAFKKAMTARDPSIKVGAVLEGTFLQALWMKNVMPFMVTWNDDVLKGAGREIDFGVVHLYAPFDRPTPRGDEQTRQLMWAGPDVFAGNLAQVADRLAKYAAPGAGIAVTEYSAFFDPESGRLDDRIASTDAAIFVALALMQFMKAPAVAIANHWSLANNGVFGTVTTDADGSVARRPAFDVFRELSRFAGARMLPVWASGNGYSVDAKGNIPGLSSVPYVQAAAALRNDGALLVSLVNRSVHSPVTIRLNAAGGPWRRLRMRVLSPAPNDSARWGDGVERILESGNGEVFEFALPLQSFAVLESDPGAKSPGL
jgi:alpha-N-arabinofuranosidase